MTRPEQGQAPPWGNDLNGWLDVGHNAAGQTLLPMSETTGWAQFACDPVTIVSGASANTPLNYDDGGNPGAPVQGDATLLDWTGGLDAPVLTSSGIWTMTVWYGWDVSITPSVGALAYVELFAQVPAGATYWDVGNTFPMDPTQTAGLRGYTTLSATPTYMEVGTVVTAPFHNGSDQTIAAHNANFWIAKLSDA